MRRRRFPVWLLALALVAGQWLVSAHDARHWQPQAKAHLCQLCLHQAGQVAIGGATALPAATLADYAALPVLAVRAAIRRSRLVYRSRAPPLSLV